MAASITKIVSATVTKTSSTVSRQGFSTPLGVHQVSDSVQPGRYKAYSSLTELTDAGISTTDRAYEWASTIFSQSPSANEVAIGRRVPGVKKVENLQITGADSGTWVLDVDDGDSTKSYSYIASGSATATDIAEGLRAQVDQDESASVTVPTSTIAVDNFDVTALIAGIDFTLTVTEPGAGTSSVTSVTANTDPEDITTALTAIEDEKESDWYFFTIDTRSDADLTAAAAYAGARAANSANPKRFFVGQTNDPDMATGTTPNIGDTLGGLSYKNVMLMWAPGDDEHMDAGMVGIAAAADLDAENGAITLALKQLAGVSPSDLTSSQIDNIIGQNGNVHVEIAGRNVVLDGKSVEGEFADVETSFAWLRSRWQEAVFRVIATNPKKVPYTNAGIASIRAAAQGVMLTAVKNGHLSGDDPDLPSTTSPTSQSVSTANKSSRTLPNVKSRGILAGAIHQVVAEIELDE